MRGVNLDFLIVSALTRRPYNQARLGREAALYARRITNRSCPDFPEDRHEEVCQEAFVALFTAGEEGLADTTGLALFRKTVIAAIRAVRRDYAAPGERTRRSPRKAPPMPARVAAEHVESIPDAETIAKATVRDGEHNHLDFDRLPSPVAAADLAAVEYRIDADRMLMLAPAAVATALRLIHIDDLAMGNTAAIVSLSRFQLHRQISAFQARWDLAA
ncbi:MAG: hypothetical protein ABIO86_10660 [Sphingomonas sp.]